MLGIGSYGFITSNQLWVLQQCSDSDVQRLKAINLLDVASNLGLSVSGIIISFILLENFKFLFATISMVLIATSLFLLFVNKKLIDEREAIKFSRSTDFTGSNNKNSKIIIYILFSVFLVGLIISQINSNYPLFLQKKFINLDTRSFSILFILNSMLVVLFQSPLVNAISKYNRIFIVGLGAFLLGFGMLFLNFAIYFYLAVISCIIYTLGEMLFFSVAQLICYEMALPNKKGSSIGIYRTVYAFSRVIGPTFGGIIFSTSPAMLWYVCGLFGLMSLLPAFYFRQLN